MEQKKKSIFRKWWFWVIVVVVLFGAIGANGDKKDNIVSTQPESTGKLEAKETKKPDIKPVETKEPTIKITASKLVQAYIDNEILADQNYKKKILEVTGTIVDIKKDILDNPYITLKTDDLIRSVQCSFSKDDLESLATLKKDSKITIQGKNDGLMMNVQLSKCKIVS